MAKLYNAVAALALATLLAGGAFLGYLFGTGHLNATRLETMARVLRGELEPQQATAAATPAAPTSQPADEVVVAAAVGRSSGGSPWPTEDELRRIRKREHLERLETERAARDLEAQRRLLDQVLQSVIQEQERLAEQKKALAATATDRQQAEQALDKGFQKELELVSSMQPRQAKEHLVRVWRKAPADAVRLLNDMDEARVKRILEQFKTPEELQIQSDLLEQIRTQGFERQASGAPVSGKTGGAATP